MPSVSHGRNGATVEVAGRRDGNNERVIGYRLILDDAYHLLSSGQVSEGMERLMSGLSEIREHCRSERWEQNSHAEGLNHPVSRLVWQDPFTEHSYRKPSGYPGDARLLDYLYGVSEAPAETSPLGKEVFSYMMAQLGARGVRSRREILAQIIDETASEVRMPRVLSIACGHLREAALSGAVNEHRIGEFVAFDQDADSLAQVEGTFAGKGVRVVQGSVRSILSQKARFENFDLVYAAGLYDYLADRVATRLTRAMFDMLAPGGRLIVANFAPCLPETGYMETFMAWKLIYRQPQELQTLSQLILCNEWRANRLFWDEHQSIVFLELSKRRRTNGSIHFEPGLRSAAIPGLNRLTIAKQAATVLRSR
jgi:SAM-dependent methyltransferase